MRLRAEDLAARRGEDLIFTNVFFDLTGGGALVLTGRNGTGKSTLLRVLAGLLEPAAGRVTIAGEGIAADGRPGEFSHYLGHRNAMKGELTVAENLGFWKAFFGERGNGGLSVPEAAEAVGLPDILHLPFAYLSAGQQRRFAFAKLLLSHRPIWLLDEPTAALDADADRLFADLIDGHRRAGGIVVAATHQPLGIGDAHELVMTGFAGSASGLWG